MCSDLVSGRFTIGKEALESDTVRISEPVSTILVAHIEEALVRIPWRTRFERGCGRVVSQTTA